MTWRTMLLITCVLLALPLPALAQDKLVRPDPIRLAGHVTFWQDDKPPITMEPKNGQDEKKGEKKNGNGEENGKKDKEEEPPAHTRDNGFLVEEASNQEAGVVQHIFNWVNFWDSPRSGRTRDFIFLYTMELPICTQTHQFSFSLLGTQQFEKPVNGPATHEGGMSDTFLNYRYQLLADDEFLWCAPRFSLILPTGDERFGQGTGRLGYQFNLPISHYGECFDCHFNVGFTYVPHVSSYLDAEIAVQQGSLRSPRHDLRAYNLGVSSFWKPQTNLHFFVEALALWFDSIDDFGNLDHSTQLFVNPGFRYAVCQLDQVEWVIGVSAPIGLTKDTPDIGLFVYMSVEHHFRKIENGEQQ